MKFSKRLVALFVLGALAGVIVVLVVYAAFTAATKTSEIRDTQLEGTPTGKKLVKSADRILDCTDPNGACYQAGQERTAKVLSDVTRVIVLAAACAVDVTPAQSVAARQDSITACITTRLSQP